jgi:hypothetical protein
MKTNPLKEKLVDEGMAEAELDHTLNATSAAEKKER